MPLSILCRVDEAWTLRLCTCLSLVLGAPLGNGWVLGRNGSNDFFFFFFNSSARDWRQQLEMALPSQGGREHWLACGRRKSHGRE